MLNAIQGLTRFQRAAIPAQNTRQSEAPPVSLSSPADAVRFSGKAASVGTDAEGDALLTSLTARLNDATDWKLVSLQDKYGQMPVGDDFIFKLDGTTYTYRGVFDKKSLPKGIKYGAQLIAEGPEGKKTYSLSHNFGEHRNGPKGTYGKHFKAIAGVAYPTAAKEAMARLTTNADTIGHIQYYSRNLMEIISFNAGDRRYTLHANSDPTKEAPKLEETVEAPSEAQIKKNYGTSVASFKAQKRDDLIEPYAEFRQVRVGQWLRTHSHALTPAQIDTIRQILTPKVDAMLQNDFGIGPGHDVRPVLLKIAEQAKAEHLTPPKNPAVTASEDGPEREWQMKDRLSWNLGQVNGEPRKIVVHRQKTYRDAEPEYSFTVRHGNPYILTLPVNKPEDKKLIDALITWGVATSQLEMAQFFGNLTSDPALSELFKPSEKRDANRTKELADNLTAKNEAFDALQKLLVPQS